MTSTRSSCCCRWSSTRSAARASWTSESFAYVSTKVVLPEAKAWADALIKEREAFWAGRGSRSRGAGSAGEASPRRSERVQDDYYSK